MDSHRLPSSPSDSDSPSQTSKSHPHANHSHSNSLNDSRASPSGPYHHGLLGNSLGLLDSFSPSYQLSSISMSQSQSSPEYSFAGNGHVQGQYHPRHGSVSPATSSPFSNSNASEPLLQQAPCSPRTHQASVSPAGLPSSLSSISGLALSTPESQSHQQLHGYPSSYQANPGQSPFVPSQHNALQALSQPETPGRTASSEIMPPPMIKRRTAQSFDSRMIHSNNLGDYHGRTSMPALVDSDGSDESTPMPPSTGTFAGAHPTELSEAFKPSHSPLTPITAGHRASYSGPTHTYATPGHSFSSNTTPDHSAKGPGSFQSSPFVNGAGMGHSTAAPMTRTHKVWIGDPFGLLTLSKLHASKHDGATNNSIYRHEPVSPHSISGHRGSLPDTSFGMGATSMARGYSAPQFDGTSSRGGSFSGGSQQGSCPMTPTSGSFPGIDFRKTDAYPTTPSGSMPPSPGYDAYFTAPGMTQSYSRGSAGSIHSPAAVSPGSVLGRRNRSMSGSVVRNTPRSRARNTGPPPLIVSSADKLHVCHCGKRFKRMEHLKRHNRTHTQERPHQCPVESCGKFFGRSDNLTQHLKTHFRPAGLVGRSSELLSLATGGDRFRSNEPRHDPHAAAQSAAAAAAAAAAHAAAATSNRGSISEASLGGPIALSKPPRPVLSPSAGLGVNGSPNVLGAPVLMQQPSGW